MAVSRLQAGGMSVDFPANEQICILHTRRGECLRIQQCPITCLYYVSILLLIDKKRLYLGGSSSKPDGDVLINQSICTTKKKPTHEMGHRVWLLHRRMKHVPLR